MVTAVESEVGQTVCVVGNAGAAAGAELAVDRVCGAQLPLGLLVIHLGQREPHDRNIDHLHCSRTRARAPLPPTPLPRTARSATARPRRLHLLAGHAIGGLGWAGDAASWAAIVVTTPTLVCLPLDFWRGYQHERRWHLSTQTFPGWLNDHAKGTAVTVALATAAWTALVAIARAEPSWWPLPTAAAAALTVLALTLLAPLLLEPLFNRFEPLPDEQLARALRDLAEQAGVPIREVLVADASRRTTKSNAYVSGLGPTRRLVVWDTLLQSACERELKLVVAHELAHRRERHIMKSSLLAVCGAVVAVLIIWPALGKPQPGDFPYAALLVLGLELVGLPFGAALSRRWERTADRYSLQLTNDRDAFIQTHLNLARSNIADLDPPRLAYLTLFTHPTPPERLALANHRNA